MYANNSFRDICIQGKNATKIVKALSSEIRMEILDMLNKEELNIQQISQNLNLSKTATLAHIKILEETGIISSRYIPGTTGNQRVCKKEYDRLIFNFTSSKRTDDIQHIEEIHIPVGNFFDFYIYPPCGLATSQKIIEAWDDPNAFYKADRLHATLVWCSFGYLEYRIPLPKDTDEINKFEITLELSAQGGDIAKNNSFAFPKELNASNITDGVSDIFFWVNAEEVGMVTAKEYARGKGGKYSPVWWGGSNYGTLITITIDENGTYINDKLSSKSVTIDKCTNENYIRFRIGNKMDSKNISGFNIYGKDFGNYAQDIVARIFFK